MDVIGLGAINVDTVLKVPRIPRADGEVAGTIERRLGGSACNTVVALAALGAKAGFIGNVGNDIAGSFALQEIKKTGVDTSRVKAISGPNGQVYIIVDEDGRRSMVATGIANSILSKHDIDRSYIRKAKALHITSLLGEKCLPAIAYAARIAKKGKVLVSLDPGNLFAEKGMRKMKPILKNVDVLLIGRKEIETLTGKTADRGTGNLLNYVSLVVQRQGAKGSKIITKDFNFFVPPFKARAVDTTGAGDAFNAGFLFRLLMDYEAMEAAEFGSAVAALTVSGTRNPGYRAVRQFLSKR